MCDASCEAPVASSETWRRARKPHECCACGEAIRPGDRYHYTSGIWDGEAASFKHCGRCWEIFRSLVAAAPGELIDFELDCGEVWEDAFGGPPPPEVAELAFLTPDEAQARLAEVRGG